MRAGLPCLVACLALCLSILTSANADPSDLSGGVFIAHAPPSLEYSSGYDWCERYQKVHSISSCEEQNPRIDLDGNLGERSVWYVIAAWEEEKEWCGTEFGFGSFDPAIYSFLDWGACLPNELEISTTNWPGPNEGTAVVATDTRWEGNFPAVYYFSGYAYSQGQIPVAEDPAKAFGGFANCAVPGERWEPQYGAIGIFQDGASVCPGVVPTDELEMLFHEYPAVCCLGNSCSVLLERDCQALRGTYYPDRVFCGPLACKDNLIEEYGSDVLRMSIIAECRFRSGEGGYTTTNADSIREYYHRWPSQATTSCVVQRSTSRIPTIQLIDDFGQWTAQMPSISENQDVVYPRFLRIPNSATFLQFHQNGTRQTKAIVDSSGFRRLTIQDGCVVGKGGLAVDGSGEYLLCLQRYMHTVKALQRGGSNKSYIAALDNVENRHSLPLFGGVAAPGDGGFWMLSHREQDIAYARPRGVCRAYLSHVERNGSNLQGIPVSDNAVPIDLARGPGAVYALYWEAQGAPRHPRLPSAPITSMYSSYPQGMHLHAVAYDGHVLNDKNLSQLGPFTQARLLEAADGSVFILADQTIVPLSGIEIRSDASWDIARVLPPEAVLPARQYSHDSAWTCRLLNSTDGWLAVGALGSERDQETDLADLTIEIWRIGARHARRATVVDNGLATKARGQFYPLVAIDGATDDTVLMSIADLGTVMLRVVR